MLSSLGGCAEFVLGPSPLCGRDAGVFAIVFLLLKSLLAASYFFLGGGAGLLTSFVGCADPVCLSTPDVEVGFFAIVTLLLNRTLSAG